MLVLKNEVGWRRGRESGTFVCRRGGLDESLFDGRLYSGRPDSGPCHGRGLCRDTCLYLCLYPCPCPARHRTGICCWALGHCAWSATETEVKSGEMVLPVY